MFNLSKGDEEASLRLIKKLYDVSVESGQSATDILDSLKLQVMKKETKTSDIGYWESLFGHKVWKGTLFFIVYSGSQQWIGCNILNIFSNRIITDLNHLVPEDKKILANQAT